MHDQFALENKLRVLTVFGIFSKFSPATAPRLSYSAEDVVTTLERICGEVGHPKTIRFVQGREFAHLDLWVYAHDVSLDFSWIGKPADNAFIEIFNSKFTSECQDAHWFMNLEDSQKRGWRLGAGTIARKDGTEASGGTHRFCCTTPVVHPARHRRKRPKTLASDNPTFGSGAVSYGHHR